MKNGFATWRSVSVINSVFASPLVLTFEFLFNQLQFKTRHIVVPMMLFLIYLSLTIFISWLIDQEPPYIGSFNLFNHDNNINWNKLIQENSNKPEMLPHILYCKDYFFSINPKYLIDGSNIEADVNQTLITIGIMLGTMIFSFLIMSSATQFSKLSDQQINELSYGRRK